MAEDEDRQRQANKKAQDAQNLQDEGLRSVMQTVQGRAWLWELLTFCGPFRSPFAQSSDVTAFQCGQQNVGLRVIGDIMRLCPDEYLIMTKENGNG